MKNVKMLLIFIITSALLLASEQRVNSLGGNVGYWPDDDNSWTAFPHTINNSNLAQISGVGSVDAHNAIVRWGDDTKWGFSWNQANENDMINLQWGNGTMGATVGFAMSSSDNGAGTATSTMGLSGSWGQQMGFGDLGVSFNYGTSDDGNAGTVNDPAYMGLSFNLRRAQDLWLFDNMLVGFSYGSSGDADWAFQETMMSFSTSLFTHIDISDGTTGLVAMGFGYANVGNEGEVENATTMAVHLPSYTFAVESAMTDWATCRVGVNAGYVLMSSSNTGVAGAADVTESGGMDTDFSVGLGFNYGSFNLDVDVNEGLFTNPVQHVTGYQSIAPAGATATLTYVW